MFGPAQRTDQETFVVTSSQQDHHHFLVYCHSQSNEYLRKDTSLIYQAFNGRYFTTICDEGDLPGTESLIRYIRNRFEPHPITGTNLKDKIVLMATGEGIEITRQALSKLKIEERKRILVCTFGGPGSIPNDLAGEVRNYLCENFLFDRESNRFISQGSQNDLSHFQSVVTRIGATILEREIPWYLKKTK